MLPKEAIEEYRQIYKQLYGVDIPHEVADEKAKKLIGLIMAIEKHGNEKLHDDSQRLV